VQQNKWRATRFGADAELVSTHDYQQRRVAAVTGNLIQRLANVAAELDCVGELAALPSVVNDAGSRQQLRILKETGSRREVVRQMIAANHWAQRYMH
jgi:carboxylate-amine ligase